MNRADKTALFDGIDEKYIQDAMPRRLLAYGATRNENIYAQRHLPLLFIETVASVATIALIVGGIFIWTLVGKDLLWVGNNGDDTNDQYEDHGSATPPKDTSTQDVITTTPNTTTTQDTTTSPSDDTVKPTPAYSEGLAFQRNETNDGYIVAGLGTCHDAVINIPPTYNGKPVTEIGKVAFYNGSHIIEVNIPSSVKIINEKAFGYCSRLKKVVVPEGVTTIIGAFYGCFNLETVELPSTLELIGERAFFDCRSLKTIVIPEGVTQIGSGAFNVCESLKEITIPGSVVSIGNSAFGLCYDLEKLTLNEGLEIISQQAFVSCESLENFVIPSSVKEIGSGAFLRCDSLTDMTVPESVTVLGSGIFSECTNLKSAVINAKVKNATSLFYRCRKLESIVFGEGIEGVGGTSICEMDSLKRVFLPSTIRHIYRCSFSYGQPLTDLEIIYNGTVAQWQAVNKEYPYAIDDPITIHCIDGDWIEGNN